MNKKNSVKHLGKPTDQRNALVKSQVKDFFKYGYLKTTKARAKAVAQKVDILMAFVEDKNLKKVGEYLSDKALSDKVSKLTLNGKKSGYTTITTLKNRAGDNAELVLIELLQEF